MTRATLFRELLGTVALCGFILFACGLLASTPYQEDQTFFLTLAGIACVGSVILVMSLGRFRTRLAAADCLEHQLVDFASLNDEPGATGVLHPILSQSAISSGWNRIVERIENRNLDEAIERRLQSVTSTGKTERFARALRSMSEGVVMTDARGQIHYTNPAWDSMLGQESAEAPKAESIITALQSLGCQNWDKAVEKVTRGTKPISIELHLGSTVHDGVLQLSRLPLVGRANESDGFLWTLRDVTQAALARDAHEQFLSSATHELRTPLTNIRAYTESLLEIEDISPTQQREFFNIINSEAGRLGRLLNQLLDIQQLEAGSMTLNSSTFDIQRMVAEVQDHIQPLVAEKSLTMTCKIAPNLKSIEADKEKITSCLVNLLGNAVKYTPSEGEIRLVAEQQETHVAISIEDTGIGIAEDELPKVFDRFYRCADERVNELEGNGLGLAFCMEVARLHGGELNVESEYNKGSKFTLRLPISKRT